MMDQYQGMQLGELSPHVFAIAEAAFRTMVKAGKSRSVCVYIDIHIHHTPRFV